MAIFPFLMDLQLFCYFQIFVVFALKWKDMVHLGVGVRPSVVGIISSKRTVIGQDFDLRHLHSVSHLDSNQEPKYDLELCFWYIQILFGTSVNLTRDRVNPIWDRMNRFATGWIWGFGTRWIRFGTGINSSRKSLDSIRDRMNRLGTGWIWFGTG